jgi:NAD(P)-dependent dehydrogenase (short-subunit alcohol dehydrogenase family)
MRIAVVTGASSGIGAALCRALTTQGWHVVGLSRRPAPDAAEHEECDVADRESAEAAAARVLARHPRIDLLVNNAGVGMRAGFLTADLDDVERVMRTNYLGSVWMLRAFLPGLEWGGSVVNVVSVAGTVAVGPYSASKHAQLGFSRSVAVELAPRGVSVHTVNPGFVETPGFPQRARFRHGLYRLVAKPELIVERILDAIEHGKPEILAPRWYRPIVWAQAIAPGVFARARSRVGSRGAY